MLLLDEPFGALDAFTREELWCILRDPAGRAAVQRDSGHATACARCVLADTVYVMSKSPGPLRGAPKRLRFPARAI